MGIKKSFESNDVYKIAMAICNHFGIKPKFLAYSPKTGKTFWTKLNKKHLHFALVYAGGVDLKTLLSLYRSNHNIKFYKESVFYHIDRKKNITTVIVFSQDGYLSNIYEINGAGIKYVECFLQNYKKEV